MIIFFIPITCLFFLFATDSGLVLIQKSVNRLIDAGSIGRVEGKLLGSWSLTDLRIFGAGANIEIGRLEVTWRPERLFQAELNITKIAVTVVDVTLKDTPGEMVVSSKIDLPQFLVPIAVSAEKIVLTGLRIIGSNKEDVFLVDKAAFNLEGNSDRLAVKEFDVQGPDIGLAMHGNIEVQRNWTLDLLGNWRFAGYGFHPITGTFSATGPLQQPHLEVGIYSPGDIRIGADIVNVLDNPEWTATLEAKDVDLSLLIEDCPKIELAAVSADFTGDVNTYRGRVQSVGTWDALKDMHLVSELTGDLAGIDFQSLRIDREESFAEAEGGKISWEEIFAWEGRFVFNNFDPSVITKELHGRLNAEFVSIGDVKENGVVASFHILSMDGALREHKVSAAGDIFLRESDIGTDGLTFRSGDAKGVAHMKSGLFSWAGEPRWSGNIRFENFDPSWLYPEFPGSVSGQFMTEGRRGADGLEGLLEVQKISGTMRGHELSGGGEIKLADKSLHTAGLVLQSGSSKLVLNGRAGDNLALDFTLSSPNIGTILPQSSGSIRINGSVKGKLDSPEIDATIKGAGLSHKDDSIGLLQAEIHTFLKSDGRLSGSLSAEEISLAGYSVDRGSIEIDGTLEEHQIVIDGVAGINVLWGKASGTYQDDWRGQLSQVRFDAGQYGAWQQETGTVVTVSENGLLLERFCLENGQSSACMRGSVQLGEELLWNVDGDVSSIPLKWLNQLKLITVPASGMVHAEFSANGDSSSVISAKSEIRVLAADVFMAGRDTEMVALPFDDSVLTLNIVDTDLQGNFNIRMQNGSQVLLTAGVNGAGRFSAPFLTLPMRGNLEVKNFNLAMLGAFTGYGVEPTGRANTIFTLAGTVGRPKIYGEIQLPDGGIELPYQGITLTDIKLSVEAEDEAAKIKATATSGPGQVTAEGTLQYGVKGIEGELEIHGKEFLLVNLPEYTIRVNPDVLLRFSSDQGEINGMITVPFGVIAPEEMSDSVNVSEDVVFVNGTEEERLKGWPFKLDINVRLGDDVRVEGYGLAGKLGGELKVNTPPGNSIEGRGELDLIDGTFTVYGRTLKIKRGRMLFSGGPIDNPGLDVRAQMKVTDKEAKGEEYIVGMDISGLVQDLQYHLFSYPFMEDTEILSLMIVGRSLANSSQQEGNLLEAAALTLGLEGSAKFVQGLGSFLLLDDVHLEGSSSKENVSLVVGKRLTKDLYIGYDMNIFSQLGQFRVRYDLARGFSVETRSSSEATGADLLYSFER